jgi:small conductance mechanosensitive channel
MLNIPNIPIDLVIRYGLQILGTIAILAVGFLLAKWAGNLAYKALLKQEMEPPVRTLLVRVVKIVVLAFTLVVALDQFGVQVAPLIAGIGVAGIGLGIALQGVLRNVMAGLSIIFTKPFRVGEYIELVGVYGQVATIDIFSTALIHADLSRVVIPNHKIVGEILHNYGTMRQLTLTIRVPHATDLSAALQAAHQVAAQSARVLKDPAPSAGIASVDDTGIKIAVWAWVRVVDVVPAEPELYQSFVEAFRARGIGVPVAAHQVRLLDGAGAGG